MGTSNTLGRPLADKTAIALSALCAAHCLLLPLAIALLPSVAALGLDDERFHIWMLVVVLPISAFALFAGCRKHNRTGVLVLGVIGLLVMGLAAFFGHDLLGELGERLLTLLGVAILTASHLFNYRLCQKSAA